MSSNVHRTGGQQLNKYFLLKTNLFWMTGSYMRPFTVNVYEVIVAPRLSNVLGPNAIQQVDEPQDCSLVIGEGRWRQTAETVVEKMDHTHIWICFLEICSRIAL